MSGGSSDDGEQLDRMAVTLTSENGRQATVETENEEWLEYDINDYAKYHDRPGYRDGHVELGFTVEKWGNKGHVVIDMTPEQLRRFVAELHQEVDLLDGGGDT